MDEVNVIIQSENLQDEKSRVGVENALLLIKKYPQNAITPQILYEWHEELLWWDERGGRIRETEVYNMFTETPSVYLPAEQVEVHLLSLCDRINSFLSSSCSKESDALFPEMEKFHKCFYFYYILLQIHPFHDGNGRIGWLFLKWFLGCLPKSPINNNHLYWILRNVNLTNDSIYVDNIIRKSHALFSKDTWRLTRFFIDQYKDYFQMLDDDHRDEFINVGTVLN